MRVVVTGGAGYVGSVAAQRLLEDGHEVHVLDRLLFASDAPCAPWGHPRYRLRRADLLEEDVAALLPNGTDVVLHLAAIVGEHACKGREDLAWRTNYDLVGRVAAAARARGIPRLLFFSTCSNYGIRREAEAREEDDLRPVGPYAEAKVRAERDLLTATDGPTACTVFRCATVFGVSPRMRFDLLLNELVRDAWCRRRIHVYGPEAWRPLLHVRDLAAAVAAYLRAPTEAVRGRVFNVGSPEGNCRKRFLAEILGRRIPGMKIDWAQASQDPRDYRVDFARIRTELGFVAERSVEEGVEEMIEALENGLFADPFDRRYTNF